MSPKFIREVPENIMYHIKNEIANTAFGTISIVLNATSNTIDIVTEQRKRFQTDGKIIIPRSKRNGTV